MVYVAINAMLEVYLGHFLVMLKMEEGMAGYLSLWTPM